VCVCPAGETQFRHWKHVLAAALRRVSCLSVSRLYYRPNNDNNSDDDDDDDDDVTEADDSLQCVCVCVCVCPFVS